MGQAGKVYVTVVPDVKAETLMTEKKLQKFKKIWRTPPHKKEKAFDKGRNHINWIESFWAFAKKDSINITA